MSTLGAALSGAVKSMTASQLALAVASNNIANASNPDYSRQRLVTVPGRPDGGPWGVGSGVDILGVESARSSMIDVGLRREVAAKSNADTLSDRLSGVEALFNDSNGTGLLQNITDFFNSFQTLSQDPASLPSRQQVKTTATALIDALHSRAQSLDEMKAPTDQAIQGDINEVNRLINQIAFVTQEIKNQELRGAANDLRDQRTGLVKQLSQFVDVDEVETGTDYQLTMKETNRLLVLNSTASPITASDVTTDLGLGSLRADLQIRDQYIPKYSAALDQLAYEITQQVNSIHSTGYNLGGNTNVKFFAPLTSATDAARQISLSTEVTADARNIAASSQSSGNDNGTAMALGGLLHSAVFTGGTVTDQYGALVFSMGSDVADAQSSQTAHQALLTQMQNRRQSLSGVSIDEEGMQVLQFQRSYEASAHLVKVVDELLQVTLAMGSQ
jgi:flagellar hook-associated protein 1